jgi:hypothetical protein
MLEPEGSAGSVAALDGAERVPILELERAYSPCESPGE